MFFDESKSICVEAKFFIFFHYFEACVATTGKYCKYH
jgi:hypothetical protein